MALTFGPSQLMRNLGMGNPERPEDQRQRYQQAMQQQMNAEVPQNVGQGMTAVAEALNYRRMKNQQAQPPVGGPVAPGADPWGGMRQTSGGLGSIINLFR